MTHFAPLGLLVVFWRLPRAITFWAFGPESHRVSVCVLPQRGIM